MRSEESANPQFGRLRARHLSCGIQVRVCSWSPWRVSGDPCQIVPPYAPPAAVGGSRLILATGVVKCYHSTMQTVEGHELTNKDLSLIASNETPTFAARPSYVTVGAGAHWTTPLLLLTNRRLLISKDRLMGKPKADFSAEWPDISNVRGELWNGGGPQIQLLVQTRRTSVELIVQPQHAVDVESAIRAGYLKTK